MLPKFLKYLIILGIIAFCQNNLFSEAPNFIFPEIGETNISRSPLLSIEFNATIDTSSIKSESNNDTDTSDVPNLYLIETSILDSVGINKAKKCFETTKIQIGLEHNKLNFFPKFSLRTNTSYSLVLNNNLRLFKVNPLDTNLIDTLYSDSLVIRNYFTTLKDPVQILSNSLDNNSGKMRCNDSIIFEFTDKLYVPEEHLKDVFKLYKFKYVKQIDSNSTETVYDSVSVTPKYIGDSTKVHVKVNGNYEYNDLYNLTILPEKLVGIPRPKIENNFSLMNRSIIDIKYQSLNQNDTLPEIIEDNGNGQRLLRVGDTLDFNFPKIVGDFYLYKLVINDTSNVSINNNELRVIGICSNMKDKVITPIYDKIPVDTLNLQLMYNVDNQQFIDNCSKLFVKNFKDSININTYTYKRFAKNDVKVYIDLCDARKFHHWVSDDNLLHGDSNTTVSILRRNNNISNNSLPAANLPKRKFIGVNVDETFNVCSSKLFKLKVKWNQIDPIDNINLASIFSSLKMNNQNIPLMVDPNNPHIASFATTSMNSTVNFNGSIGNQEVEISFLSDKRGKIYKGESSKFDFENRIGNSFNENLTVGNIEPCNNELTVEIRRKVRKYDVELVVDSGKTNVPPYKILHVTNDPVPDTDLNEDVNTFTGNNVPIKEYKTNSLGERYCSKITYPYYYYYGTTVVSTPFLLGNQGFEVKQWNDSNIFVDEEIIDTIKKKLRIIANSNKASQLMSETKFTLDFIGFDKVKVNTTTNNETEYVSSTEIVKLRINPDITTSESGVWIGDSNDPGMGPQLTTPLYKYQINGETYPKGVKSLHTKTASIRFWFSKSPDLLSLKDNIIIEELGTKANSNILLSKERIDGLKLTSYKPSNVQYGSGYEGYNFPNCKYGLDEREVIMIVAKNTTGLDQQWLSNLTSIRIGIRNRTDNLVQMDRIKAKSEPNSLPELLTFPVNKNPRDFYEPTYSNVTDESERNSLIEKALSHSFYETISGNPKIKIETYHLETFKVKHFDHYLWGSIPCGDDPDLFIYLTGAITNKNVKNFVNTSSEKKWKYDNDGKIVFLTAHKKFPETGHYNNEGQEHLDEDWEKHINKYKIIEVPYMLHKNDIYVSQNWFDSDPDFLSDGIIDKIAEYGSLIAKLLFKEEIEKYATIIGEVVKELNDGEDDFLGESTLKLSFQHSQLNNGWNENVFNSDLFFVDDNDNFNQPSVEQEGLLDINSTMKFEGRTYSTDMNYWGTTKSGFYSRIGRVAQGGNSENNSRRSGTLLNGKKIEFICNLERLHGSSYIITTTNE